MAHKGRKNRFDSIASVPRSAAEPQNLPDPDAMPDDLSDEMVAWWKRITSDYNLETHELCVLAAACRAWDRCEQARKIIAREGLTVMGQFGPRAHPCIAIERDARLAFARLVRDLKLKPPPAYNDIGFRTR
jgi:phage terminase small subunit